MKYIIVEGGTADELTKVVQQKIDEGWRPIGSVAVAVMGALSEDTFYQAMVPVSI